MTDDLTTLLRAAGREPTVDPDVDAIHARGRRRTAVRRTAVGAGALALLGVLGVGVTSLLDTPDAPIVDQEPAQPSPTPIDEATDEPTPPATGLGVPTVTAADVAMTHGIAVHELLVDASSPVAFDITVTTPEGVDGGRWVDGAEQFGRPVVADDGGIWALTIDGRTVRRDPVTGETVTIAGPEGIGTGWLPIGPVADGVGSVLVTEIGLGDTTLAEPSAVYVATADGVRPFAPFPAVDPDALDGDEYVALAAAADERLVVLAVAGESYRAVLLPSGTSARTLHRQGGTSWLVDVAVARDEAWVAGFEEGVGPTLHRVDLTDPASPAVAVPLPAGVTALEHLRVSPDGAVVVVGVRTATDRGVTLVLDTAAIRAGTPGSVTALDTEAIVTPLPFTPSSGPLAGCAGQPVNPLPGDEVSVWFLCWDAAERLAEGAAHPFVHGDQRFVGADLAPGAAGIRAVLEAWAAGPTRAEAAAGLTGGLDAEVAMVTGVTLDGGTATVDLEGGPQVGVLGTTTGRATTVQAIVGAVLQFAGVDAVRITLDGSCADWAALAETEGCPTYDEGDAPWSQGLAADPTALPRTDLEDGRHLVDATSADAGGLAVTVDVLQWLTGEEARAAYEAETGDPEGPPNGYLIRNENDRLRTLPVAADVDVQLVRLAQTGTADLEPADWPGFVTYLDDPASDGSPFWLRLEGGVVTAIEEQYLP